MQICSRCCLLFSDTFRITPCLEGTASDVGGRQKLVRNSLIIYLKVIKLNEMLFSLSELALPAFQGVDNSTEIMKHSSYIISVIK